MPGAIEEWRLLNQFREGLEHGLSQDQAGQSWWEYGVEHTTYREGLYPQDSPPVSFAFREAQPVPQYTHLGYRTDYPAGVPVRPVPEGTARTPHRWSGEIAPTPTPAQGRSYPPGIGAPSERTDTGPAKQAPKKEPAPVARDGLLDVFHQGRRL